VGTGGVSGSPAGIVASLVQEEPYWWALDELLAELDLQLARGSDPNQLLLLACRRLEAIFGYPIVVLRGTGRVAGEVPLLVAGSAAGALSEQQPPMLPWPQWQQERIGTALALRVRFDRELEAVLHVFAREREGFTSGELDALSVLARRMAVLLRVGSDQRWLRLQSAALAGAANAIFITDPEGSILWVNRAFAKMTGYDSGEVLGDNPRILNSGLHDRPFFSAVWQTINSGQVWEGEVVERHRDGHLYTVHQTITPILEDGVVSHFIAIHEDVTERKQLLTELYEARDRALDAARLRTQFLANMSHEVRTPMNGVLGMLELLADTPLSAEQRHYLSVARRSARALLDSLNEVLDYSQLEAVGVRLEATDVDLYDLLDEVVETMAGVAGERRLELYYRLLPGCPGRVRLDPTRLKQVLTNLVSNALKFTEQGGVAIRGIGQGGQLRFEVEDSGCGIPELALARIFEAFQQVDGSTTRRHGGTGLGLAICRQLVQRMGGEIGVESRIGEGSRFHFTVAWEPPLTESALPCKRHRVVLAEARPLLAEAMTDLLTVLGCEVEQIDRAAPLLTWQEGEGHPLLLLAERLADMDSTAELATQLAVGGARVAWIAPPGTSSIPPGPIHQLHRPLTRAQLQGALGEGEAGWTVMGPELRGRVLVAEDHPVNQQVTVAMLHRLGVVAEVVADGQAAVEQAANGFSLILMDSQMPVLDGQEAARRIRAAEAAAGRPPIPIIALTAHTHLDEAQLWRAAGMDGLLTKPLTLAALRQVLVRYLPTVATADERPGLYLDPRAVAQLEAIGSDAAITVLDTWLADAPGRLELLLRCYHAGDKAATARVAHTLKGSCAAVGLTDPARLLGELEQRIGDEDPLDSAQLIARITRLMGAAQGELLRLRQRFEG